MILYHGSDLIVKHPDIFHSGKRLDFGVGFYTTSVKEQAERWARRKALFREKEKGIMAFMKHFTQDACLRLPIFSYSVLDTMTVHHFSLLI